jgi:ATP-dependent RNA helicase DeaD
LTNLEKFRTLWISEKTLKLLEKKWFETPSPIQEKVIPILLKWEKNLIWQAATGTWKTAAFGVPLAERIIKHETFTQAIIMAPTRELAIQVADEIRSFLHDKSINVVTIYGWQSYEIQLRELRKWADIIVWTPWRLIDHLNRNRIKLDKIKYMILDEADEMLNMWFIDDIKEILNHTNDTKNTLLFSATMPREIINVAKKYMWEYEIISVKSEQNTTIQTEQFYFNVQYKDKLEALCRVMDVEPDFFGLVFCKTKLDVDDVTAKLTQKWYSVEWIHWDIAQNQRERIIQKFKTKKIKVLIATDVAARWIDVNDITHVINYCLPQNPEAYIHRVGRTGRANKKWVAITFVSPSEAKRLPFFKKATKTDIKLEKIPNIEAVLVSKKSQITKEIDKAIENNSFVKQIYLTKEILQKHDAETIIAALLELKYENELCKTKYKEITEIKDRPSYNRNRDKWWSRSTYRWRNDNRPYQSRWRTDKTKSWWNYKKWSRKKPY